MRRLRQENGASGQVSGSDSEQRVTPTREAMNIEEQNDIGALINPHVDCPFAEKERENNEQMKNNILEFVDQKSFSKTLNVSVQPFKPR